MSDEDGAATDGGAEPPLCVDLDHTLVTTDLLWESLFLALASCFWAVALLPLWLLKGKAAFKREVASRHTIAPDLLPYREDLVEYLRAEKARGRTIILTTAADELHARAVADHLGLFDDVLASDGAVNLGRERKLAKIQERWPTFDYIGDGAKDLPLLTAARRAHLVDASAGFKRRVEAGGGTVAGEFKQSRSPIKAALKLMRPKHWAKNTLIFVPLVTSHQLMNGEKVLAALFAFIAFSLCASSIYVLNDLVDLESDRRHPRKRKRPLAAGSLATQAAVVLFVAMMTTALTVAALVSIPTLSLVLAYVVLTTSYSFYFKQKLFLDVLTLAGLYTHRLFVGGVAAEIELSDWLLTFSLFFFMSIALAKRFCELSSRPVTEETNKRRGYRREDIALIGNLGPTCGYISVLVLALYLNSKTATALYATPQVLLLLGPLLLYWLTRMWFLAHRGELPDDPLAFAVRDKISYLTVIACGCVLFAAWLPEKYLRMVFG